MVVRIVKDWQYPQTFFGQTPKGDGVWEDVVYTEEPVAECDYLLVLQRPPYTINVKCPKGNAWIITQEPPTDYFRFYTKSFKYFDRVFTYYKDTKHPSVRSMQPALPWHLLKSYQYLKSLSVDNLSRKKNDVVWITSNKKGFAGQKARMRFREYLEKANFNFHLYGRGFTHIDDKFDGLFPCKYALSIENYSEDNYWTEKIADAFLSWCLPFYWGAKNVEDYFPPESFIRIDIHNPENAMRTIQKAIADNEWERRLPAIEKARKLILEQYQFFPYITKLIKEDSSTSVQKPMKDYAIPANPYPWSYKVKNQVKYYLKRVFNWEPF